jgi:carboxypeptidase D
MLSSHLNIPLRGIAIGNGWIDAKRQSLSYFDYSVKMGLLEENSDDWKKVKGLHEKCEELVEKVTDEPMKISACQNILLAVINKKTAE